MPKYFCIQILLLLGIGNLLGQEMYDEEYYLEKRPFVVYEQNGETIMDGTLAPIEITAKAPSRYRKRQARKKIQKLTRLRWNIHRTYPYAIKVSEIVAEVEAEVIQMKDSQEKKDYIKDRERALFKRYEKDLRKMSRSQGRVLVKLIHRQTQNTAFHLIKDTRNGVTAFFWQSIGSIFGINLKREFDPEEDAMMDEIVQDLERGGYNIYYKQYNYRVN